MSAAEYPFMSFESMVDQVIGSVDQLEVVDLGAGSGRVTRQFAALGAHMTGVEPNEGQVEIANRQGNGERYIVGSAEATGLPDDSCDMAMFSLSLHHVPNMSAGVAEARRITRPGGHVLVIEPVAPDPFYPVLKYVDDESAVYQEAQQALATAVASGDLEHVRTVRFGDKQRVDTVESLIDELVTIDNGRSLADADRPAFEQAFDAAVMVDAEGRYIPYWSRADLYLCL